MFAPTFIETSSTDYWYDEGLVHSRKILEGFDDMQWELLCAAWHLQSGEWQERLAYILGDGGKLREAALLIQMVCDAARSVALGAAESLRDMPPEAAREAFLQFANAHQIPEARTAACISVNAMLDVVEQVRTGTFRREALHEL